ncbi:ATP-binding cassette domain-containing protein [Mycoplasmatota bacterium WC44]
MNVIEVKDLKKTFKIKVKESGFKNSLKALLKPTYRNVDAVNDISFSISKGEMIAFIGPNGAGKSTVIKMLTGILYPDAGDIEILGMNPQRDRKKLAYKIGTVFGQKEQLWIHLSPYDNFKFFGAIYDIDDEVLEERISELKELFEIEEFINSPVRNLSLGQRIRCEIVASLLHKPEILFLDEPTIGLDPVVKENIRRLIKKMNKEYDTTVFLTSHDVGDIEKLCKRVIIINSGKMVLDDLMKNLKYKFFDKKIVDVKLSEAIDLSNIDGVTILKNKKNSIRFEVDTKKNKITDIISMLDAEKVVDINFSHVPLEEVISGIYSEGKL